MNEIISYLNGNINDWNIFIGGVTNVWDFNKNIKINDNLNLLNINKGKTTHFMIYNENCYDFFLNHDINIQIDKCWNYKLKAFTSVPFIAIQNDGLSTIENRYVNYNYKFKSIENSFKRLLLEKK